jgi:hypothetical protein
MSTGDASGGHVGSPRSSAHGPRSCRRRSSSSGPGGGRWSSAMLSDPDVEPYDAPGRRAPRGQVTGRGRLRCAGARHPSRIEQPPDAHSIAIAPNTGPVPVIQVSSAGTVAQTHSSRDVTAHEGREGRVPRTAARCVRPGRATAGRPRIGTAAWRTRPPTSPRSRTTMVLSDSPDTAARAARRTRSALCVLPELNRWRLTQSPPSVPPLRTRRGPLAPASNLLRARASGDGGSTPSRARS